WALRYGLSAGHARRSRTLWISPLRRSKPLFAKPQSTSHIATTFSVARFTRLVRPWPPTPTAAMFRRSLGAVKPRPITDRGTIVKPATTMATFRINFRLDSLMTRHSVQKIYLRANCITRFPLLLVTKPKLALVGLEFGPFQLG